MNLADIRKKALAERENGGETPPLTAQESAFDEAFDLDVAPAAAVPEFITAAEEPAPEPSRPLPFAREPVAEMTGKDRSADIFDPVAVLMAWRDQVEAIAEHEAAAGVADLEENLEFLCCRVDSEEYAVNILEIKEIIKLREMTEVPRTPAFVSGVFSLRGVIVSVIDMRRRLGLAEGEETPRERIIVVKKGAGLCGLHVDEVLEVVKIHERAIEPPPSLLEGIDREFVTGIGRHEGRILILLNLEKILDIHLC